MNTKDNLTSSMTVDGGDVKKSHLLEQLLVNQFLKM